MTFLIDTGAPQIDTAAGWRIDRNEALVSGVMDALPADATQAQIDNALVLAILGQMRSPAMLGTVRRHLVGAFGILAPIAFRDPAAFDAVLQEYAELTTMLPEDASEAHARRKASAALR